MPNDCPARDWGYTSAGASSTSTVVASGSKVSPGRAVGFSFGFPRRPVVSMRRWIEEAQSPKCCVSRPRTGSFPGGGAMLSPRARKSLVWAGGGRSPPPAHTKPFPTHQRQTVFGGCWPGFARPAPSKNTLPARGEDAGIPPRCGPVRRRGAAEFCSSPSVFCPNASKMGGVRLALNIPS